MSWLALGNFCQSAMDIVTVEVSKPLDVDIVKLTKDGKFRRNGAAEIMNSAFAQLQMRLKNSSHEKFEKVSNC